MDNSSLFRITLDLPPVPSVNRLWKIGKNKRTGKSHLYRSPQYTHWLKEAGWSIQAQKPKLLCKAISGPYSMILRVRIGKLGDIDNLTKAVSDLLQEHQIIQNDRLCRKLLVIWDDKLDVACRVILRAARSQALR